MGHIHLGVLPNSRKWREVVDLLDGRASDQQIVSASAQAAETEFRGATSDPGFIEAVRLLAMIPQAARSADFVSALRDLGLRIGPAPGLPELLVATGEHLDREAHRTGGGSDFGELARRALLSTLSAGIGGDLPGLFEATAQDVRAATAKLGTSARFSPFARAFFSRLVSETLSSYLDRTLSTHVGPGRHFSDMGDRSAFDAALDQYCAEATRIIREFSGGWYGKTLHREGRIDSHHAAAYGAVALKKITEELRRKQGAHG